MELLKGLLLHFTPPRHRHHLHQHRRRDHQVATLEQLFDWLSRVNEIQWQWVANKRNAFNLLPPRRHLRTNSMRSGHCWSLLVERYPREWGGKKEVVAVIVCELFGWLNAENWMYRLISTMTSSFRAVLAVPRRVKATKHFFLHFIWWCSYSWVRRPIPKIHLMMAEKLFNGQFILDGLFFTVILRRIRIDGCFCNSIGRSSWTYGSKRRALCSMLRILRIDEGSTVTEILPVSFPATAGGRIPLSTFSSRFECMEWNLCVDFLIPAHLLNCFQLKARERERNADEEERKEGGKPQLQVVSIAKRRRQGRWAKGKYQNDSNWRGFLNLLKSNGCWIVTELEERIIVFSFHSMR